MTESANEYAFPRTHRGEISGAPGLTKREYFAGLAMQGILASFSEDYESTPSYVAANAVEFADKLLEALED